MSYSMLPIKVKIIEFNENLNHYNIEKIEVYTYDEVLKQDKLLIENTDYKFYINNNKTVFENLSENKIRRISIFRDPKRYMLNSSVKRIQFLYAKYFDHQNKNIANFNSEGDTTVYHVGFPKRN